MLAAAERFELAGDRRGVLCVHGFTGTPFEMRYLGERLAERGMTVVGPVLPGHGTTPDALAATTWTDWYGAVVSEVEALRRRCDRIAVVGQSLGGLLTLHLAAERPELVAAIATLGAPLWFGPVSELVARLAGWPRLARLIPQVGKRGGESDAKDPWVRRHNPAYRAIPTAALASLRAFMRVVDAELDRITVPTLVLHGRRDHTAPLACAERIAMALAARDVRRRTLPDSQHLIACDVDKAIVAAEVGAFFERRL